MGGGSEPSYTVTPLGGNVYDVNNGAWATSAQFHSGDLVVCYMDDQSDISICRVYDDSGHIYASPGYGIVELGDNHVRSGSTIRITRIYYAFVMPSADVKAGPYGGGGGSAD